MPSPRLRLGSLLAPAAFALAASAVTFAACGDSTGNKFKPSTDAAVAPLARDNGLLRLEESTYTETKDVAGLRLRNEGLRMSDRKALKWLTHKCANLARPTDSLFFCGCACDLDEYVGVVGRANDPLTAFSDPPCQFIGLTVLV